MSTFAYFNEFCRSRGGPVLTSEYYLDEISQRIFQLKIFHVDRIDRDIYAKNRRKHGNCRFLPTSVNMRLLPRSF